MASICFPQFENEVFWRYYYRLGDFLGPNHLFEQWELCMVIYEGLNEDTRLVLDSMSSYIFVEKTPEECWDLIEQLARDTYEWEMTMFVEPTLQNFSFPIPQTHTPPPYYCSYCHCHDHDTSLCPYNESYVSTVNPFLRFDMQNFQLEPSYCDMKILYNDDDDDGGFVENVSSLEEGYHLTFGTDEEKLDITETLEDEESLMVVESMVEKSLVAKLMVEDFSDKFIHEGGIVGKNINLLPPMSRSRGGLILFLHPPC